MSNQLGPLEVVCDAPSYSIVRACCKLGFQSPEDVRWCRVSHSLDVQTGWQGIPNSQLWMTSGMHRPRGLVCSCDQELPQLNAYTFMLITGLELTYYLGQCARCRAMYWEKA